MLSEQEEFTKQQDIMDFARFAEGKSATAIVEMYKLLDSIETSDQTNDKFDSAMKIVFEANLELKLEVASLLSMEQSTVLRVEAYYVVVDIVFTNPVAQSLVVDTLLKDPEVNGQVEELLRDDISGADEAPLVDILRLAEVLAKIKDDTP